MKRIVWVVVAVVAGLLILSWAKSCADRSGEEPKIPPQVQRDLDSLQITRPTHNAAVDSALMRARRDSIARVQAQREAARAQADARESRRVADSIAAVAQSVEQWKAAHDARQKEAVKWEQTASQKDIALQKEISAHSETRRALTLETTRRVHLETVTIPGLTETIARLEKPCKVGFIPCPSRTVVGIISAGSGYLLGQALPARR